MGNIINWKMLNAVREVTLKFIQESTYKDDSRGQQKDGVTKSDILKIVAKDEYISGMKRTYKNHSGTIIPSEYNHYVSQALELLLNENLITQKGIGRGARFLFKEPELQIMSLNTKRIVFFEIISGDIQIWLPNIEEKIKQQKLGFGIHLIVLGKYLMCIDEHVDSDKKKKATNTRLNNIVSNAIRDAGCSVYVREVGDYSIE